MCFNHFELKLNKRKPADVCAVYTNCAKSNSRIFHQQQYLPSRMSFNSEHFMDMYGGDVNLNPKV